MKEHIDPGFEAYLAGFDPDDCFLSIHEGERHAVYYPEGEDMDGEGGL